MSPPTSTPTKINDYLILPITLPAPAPAPPAVTATATHFLYLKRHAPKIRSSPADDDDKSLFVVNVPVDATEAHLRALFSRVGGGRVEKVLFDGVPSSSSAVMAAAGSRGVVQGDGGEGGEGKVGSRKRKRGVVNGSTELPKTWDRELRKSGSTAVVVFVDRASCEMTVKALKRSKTRVEVVWGEGIGDGNRVPALGISRYLTHHNLTFPDKAVLQQSVDAYMTMFAEEEEHKKRVMAKRRQEPDEDGFITVVRGGRVAPARQEDVAAALVKKESGINQGFYRFQLREQRKERQQQLLAKFEQDKKKVAERKSQRKFKPL